MATFVQAVNNVLQRLREDTVTNWDDTDYSAMLGILINDAKREIEDAHDWTQLQNVITVNTTADDYSYTLTGSGNRFRMQMATNDTSDTMLQAIPVNRMRRYHLIGTTQSGTPNMYSLTGVDSNGDYTLDVYPTPDGVYSLVFDVVIPQADLTASANTISVPFHLVCMLAYAKAIAERGEDSGATSSEAYMMYRMALADAIGIDRNHFSEDVEWVAT